ncbi:M16 family metallopeptidase [Hugenholtzia roseola]|uniref:M16 family metallopeptidase n=1 Tax=Hugenholtzia roseola TaxID=1002 RepID=UPI00047CF92A|nr:pitrilysin family protein [Hugenholtzia roseola]
MLHFETFTLANGLRFFVHQDKDTPMAVFNLMYDVGSRDEEAHKTGFAHLFEHLMFGGSKHIPTYDRPLQLVGGSNNAFTSPDLTNYYDILPANNLETAFWLESDRMLALDFSEEPLEVQRKVVIEEFKQRYLNQPYGDVWLKLRPLAYQQHPYRWATIGKEISHIEQATLQDVKDFFYRYYLPNNAIAVVAGNVTTEQVEALAQKWFAPIPKGERLPRLLPQEPLQTEARFEETAAKVPLDAIYKAYKMSNRLAQDYHATDLLSDMLARDEASPLFRRLVREKEVFVSLQSYIMGSFDEGLLVIQGKVNPTHTLEEAHALLEQELERVVAGLDEKSLQRVKNHVESGVVLGNIELFNRAVNLAYATLLGNTNLVNTEIEQIRAVSLAQVKQVAQKVLNPQVCSTLFYRAIR